MIGDLFTLAMLIFLQAVLGFDNLLYISLESKRVDEQDQQKVRRLGIGLAIFLRIALLLILIKAIAFFQEPFWNLEITGILEWHMTGHAVIVLVGGLFILHTAVKEISHMLSIDHLEEGGHDDSKKSVVQAVAWILLMNLVFSFDSILSAIAIAKDKTWIMVVAIIISGIAMIALADTVANFLKKNRLYEVLGLFILFLVGVMLLSEGGHLAHIKAFGHEIHKMQMSTFYFAIVCLVLVDIAQGRYQKKLDLERAGLRKHKQQEAKKDAEKEDEEEDEKESVKPTE